MPEDPSFTKDLINSLIAHNRFTFHNLNNQQKDFDLNSLLQQGSAHFDFPLKTWFYYPTEDNMERDLKKFDREQLTEKKLDQYKTPEGNMKDLFALTLEGILMDQLERAFHDKCKIPGRAAAHMAARIRVHGSNQGYWKKLHEIIVGLYQAQKPQLQDRNERE